jgi:hypothetical protein
VFPIPNQIYGSNNLWKVYGDVFGFLSQDSGIDAAAGCVLSVGILAISITSRAAGATLA